MTRRMWLGALGGVVIAYAALGMGGECRRSDPRCEIAVRRHQAEDASMHGLAGLAQQGRVDRLLDERVTEGEGGIARNAVA